MMREKLESLETQRAEDDMEDSEEDEDYTAGDAEEDFVSSGHETTSEEEEEEEEDRSKKSKASNKSKGKKKRRLNPYIQEEASEDDEGDEEEEDDDEDDEFANQFIAKEGVDDEDDDEPEDKGPTASDYRRLHRERLEREDIDMEAEEERLKSLYGRVKYLNKKKNSASAREEQVPQQLLLPTDADSKLWLVKCKIGKERAVVHQLLRACLDLQYSEAPVQILSCLARDNLKGYVYVEAHKAAHVSHAVDAAHLSHMVFCGTAGARVSLVPLGEMPQVLDVSRISSSAQASDGVHTMPRLGSFVRVRRGLYGGDLAQVMQVPGGDEGEDNLGNAKVQLKLLPRVSYSQRVSAARPEQRPFDPEEANQHGPVTRSRGFWMYGKESYKNGFLLKDFALRALQCEQVNPTPKELDLIGASSSSNEQLSPTEQNEEITAPKLNPNDKVIITEGEFINLRATIQQVMSTPGEEEGEPERVWYKVQPLDSSLVDSLDIEAAHLSKYFDHGDQVQLLSHPPGRTAIVVSCSPAMDSVTLYSAELGQLDLPLDAVIASTAHPHMASKQSHSGEDLFTLRQMANIPTSLTPSSSSSSFKEPLQLGHSKSQRGLVGRIVSVAGGPYKGYIGMVKHVDPLQGVKVELQTNSKLITLPPDRVVLLERGSSSTASSRSAQQHAANEGGARTPGWNSAKTPAWNNSSSSKTPAWTSKTPAWSSKTPAWNAKTPTWGAAAGGAGAGGKTPSWKDADGKTPSWKLGTSKTPSWEPQAVKPSSKTPSWSHPATASDASASANPAYGATTAASNSNAPSGNNNAPITTSGNINAAATAGGFIIEGVVVSYNNQEYSIVKNAPSISLKRISDESDSKEVVKNVEEASIKPCPPAKRDRAIIYGDGSMLRGTVIGLDDPEAVVKIDGTGEFKIVKAAFLAKIL